MAALFFDIDGTLISEYTGEIPESAQEALRAARANGHKIFINTGRTLCCLPPSVRTFGLTDCCADAGLICFIRISCCWRVRFLLTGGLN